MRSTAKRGHHFIKSGGWPALGVASLLGSAKGAPARAAVLMGSAGQPAESDVDSRADAGISSDEGS
eukprot:6449351-Pyramimonas_sp.AAC.1